MIQIFLSIAFFLLLIFIGIQIGRRDKHVKVQNFASLYSNEERVATFQPKIRLSTTRHAEYVILEPCFKEERVNMPLVGGSLVLSLYSHLPFIFDLGVLIPFNSLRPKSYQHFSPSEITPHIWSIIRAFEIRCRRLEVTPSAWIFFSFFMLS